MGSDPNLVTPASLLMGGRQRVRHLEDQCKTGPSLLTDCGLLLGKEASGDNALPLILSLMCARLLGGESETDIVQLQRVFHTGADPMERMRLRPSFEGTVRPGAGYVLVGDVSSMGGTLAELASYILLNGGRVLGTILLVNAGRSKAFQPMKRHVRLLEERFSDEIRQIFGIHTTALTANEAGYLVGFRTADEIRNRLAKAEKETHLRLLSKGC